MNGRAYATRHEEVAISRALKIVSKDGYADLHFGVGSP